jgi:hypothetical protein
MSKSYQEYGDAGEKEVASLVPCPNCHKPLMTMPKNYPLIDVQCTACIFRAQVKSSSSSPLKAEVVRGSGWDIMDKTIKSGYLIPPVIVNFKWTENTQFHQEIRFYPFLNRQNLVQRLADIKSANRKYKMFDYSIKDLPYITLYTNT